jgi:hypothetical protein
MLENLNNPEDPGEKQYYKCVDFESPNSVYFSDCFLVFSG